MGNNFTEKLFDEYRIIQEKIDKIGEFKFKVRGWSITIATAIAASLLTETVPKGLWPLPFVIAFIFHFLEQQQTEYSSALSKRAIDIEEYLNTIYTGKGALNKTDQIIRTKMLAKIRATPKIGKTLRATAKRGVIHILSKMWGKSTNFFYYCQYFLFVLIVAILFIGEQEPPDKNDDIMISNNKPIIHQHESPGGNVMEPNLLSDIEDSFTSICAQIEDEDITNIDVYWEALAENLLELDIPKWQRPKKDRTVSSILDSLHGVVEMNEELVGITQKMEEICRSDSEKAIGKRQMNKLSDLSEDFNVFFYDFIEGLKENNER